MKMGISEAGVKASVKTSVEISVKTTSVFRNRCKCGFRGG